MKQLLFLLLFPCLALAQYQGNGNQKITLGEQTTSDGLVWRGLRADTTSKIVPFSDTSAYIILDTVEKTLWLYKAGQVPKWQQVGGSTLDTATMLLPYYRAGRNTIIQAADVPTLNQNTTGSAATLTTGRTIQTNLASTSTATFNGSANITPGVTGTLPVANGGTGQSTLTANKVMVGNGTTGVLTPTNLHWDNTNSRLGINKNNPSWTLEVLSSLVVPARFSSTADATIMAIDNSAVGNGNPQFKFYLDDIGKFSVGVDDSDSDKFKIGTTDLATDTRLTIDASGNVGIGTTSPAVQFHTTGGVRFAGLASITDLRTDADGDLFNGSDFNLKNSIDTINFGLSDVLKLKPVSFNWNDEQRNINEYKSMGFIAQDVMNIIPNAASTMGDGNMQVDYNAIVATLTKAIQEQQAIIKALEQRILNLENK